MESGKQNSQINDPQNPKGYVLAIGESLIDALSHNYIDNLSEAKNLQILPGGSPANFCRFLQSIGTNAKLVASVGKDGFGSILIKSMQSSGLSIEHISQLEDHFTSLIVVARTKNTPDFIPYRDADIHIQPVAEDVLNGALLVHSSAFSLSKEPARSVILEAFRKMHSKGKPVSLDWNYSEKIWGVNNSSQEVFNEVLKFNPILKFSLDDAKRYFEQDLSIEQAKKLLSDFPAEVICFTCGSEGVWYKSADCDWTHQPAEPIEVKDATGAGDAFWAGFIYSYLKKEEIVSCVKNGIFLAGKRLRGQV